MEAKRKRPIDLILAIASIPVGAAFLLSAGFLIPITFRPYYFLHCHILDIPGSSGYSMEEIRLAFNDVMDFIWLGKPFATGNLPHSAEGAAHFADCVPLFWLDLIVFLITGALLLTYFILIRTKVVRSRRFLGLTGINWGSFGLLTIAAAVGVWALIDFNGLFVAFHTLFFPGKENWVFDPTTDPIINILPESFFACCAGFILTMVVLLSIGFLLYSLLTRKRYKRMEKGSSPV